MSKRKSRAGLILMLLGGGMLLAAGGFLAANLYEENQATTASASALQQIHLYLAGAGSTAEVQSAAQGTPVLTEVAPGAAEPVPLVPEVTPLPVLADQPLYVQNPDITMPEKRIDGQAYIGMMSIPKLGLELPVISEWSYPKLKLAPCRYTGSVYRDDMIICGH
ncbi:MAG: sortase, partial [Aristaeellaceae bacterium]